MRPLGAVPGFFHTGRRLPDGALVLAGYAGAPVWMDAEGQRAVILEGSPDGSFNESYYGVSAVSGEVVARGLPNGAESRIEIYRW